MTITVSFMSANYVARELGYRMNGWGEGDRATQDAFSPLESYAERFDAILADVAALGFDAVDVWDAHLNPAWATDDHVGIAREALDRRGLRVTTYQAYVGADLLERTCAIAERLGAPVLSGNAPVGDPRLPELLERHGLRYALENHPEPTPQVMLDKIGDTPGVGICVDTGWFGTQGYDAVRAIEEIGDRVHQVHLKDVLHEGLPHETCRYGAGVVDIEGCVRALRAIGYSGAISIEHEPETHDPTEEIRVMREQVEGWLG
jgi:sugar phosphate isomerase/epimerase